MGGRNVTARPVLTNSATAILNGGVAQRSVLPPATSLEAVERTEVTSVDLATDSQYLSSTPSPRAVPVSGISYSHGRECYRLVVKVDVFPSLLCNVHRPL